MLDRFIILIIFSVIWGISCTSLKNTPFYRPCKVDQKNLVVKGNDFDFKDSIGNKNIFTTHTILRLMGVSFLTGYRVDRNQFLKDKKIDFKICHCRDTLWAKKQLLNEVTRRYPYHIVDSFERHKVYDMTFFDTSYFGPPNYTDPLHIGFSVSSDGKVLTKFNREYPDVAVMTLHKSYENKGTRVHMGKITPEYLRYQRYDVQFPYNLYGAENISIADYSQYLKDSMGIVITLADEYTIPIKVIRLK